MVITQPTVDDFSDTTVMRVIRKIVNYICNDLVPSINQEQKIVTAITPSLDGNILTITLTFDDDSTISGSVDLSDIAGGGGSDNPYPTGVDLSVSGNNLSINIPMSGASALKDTVALPQSGTDFNSDDYDIYFGPSGTGIIAQIVKKDTVQTTDPSINLSSSNNTMSLHAILKNSVGSTIIVGTSETPIINSVFGTVTDGKLKITVNGVSSGDIPLPIIDVTELKISTSTVTYDSGTRDSGFKYPITMNGTTEIGINVRATIPVTLDLVEDATCYHHSSSNITNDILEEMGLNNLPDGDYRVQFSTIFDTISEIAVIPSIGTNSILGLIHVSNGSVTKDTNNFGRCIVNLYSASSTGKLIPSYIQKV